MQRSILSAAGVVVLGFVLLLVNSIAGNLFGRFYVDLTEDKLYTLSSGSRNILAALQSPVTLRLYLSKTEGAKYPAIKLYGDRVTELLREYERKSNGKISLEIYDPRPDSEEETWAGKYGITPLAMPSGDQLFFGLSAVNARGDEETIPVFNLNRQEFLEYDLTRLLFSLSREHKPMIGVISSLPLKGQPPRPQMIPGQTPDSDPWVLLSQIQNFGEVRTFEGPLAEIPNEVKLLLLIHPKGLEPQTIYAIDQFVMRGGSLFVAVDPYCNADQPPTDAQNPMAGMFYDRSSSLKELLPGWGVELAEKKVVGDMALATKVLTGNGGMPEDFLLWLTMTSEPKGTVIPINRSNVLTSQLDTLMFPWAGSLTVKPVEGVTSETLFQTSAAAKLFDKEDYQFGGGSPAELLNRYTPGKSSLIVGLKLGGKLKSNFKERPKFDGDSANLPAHLSEAANGAHVVVVADVDFLTDAASAEVQNFLGTKVVSLRNDNLVFAGNLVENLLGSNDLISLRSRGQFTRPFTRVLEIEQHAQQSWKMEEVTLMARLNAANERLTELQSAANRSEDGKGEQVFTKALLDELKKFRDERAEAQERLREVRRNLRQDKERLGSSLFAINTFLVPLLLIVGGILWYARQSGKGRASS